MKQPDLFIAGEPLLSGESQSSQPSQPKINAKSQNVVTENGGLMYVASLLEAAFEKVTQSGVDKSCMQKQYQAL